MKSQAVAVSQYQLSQELADNEILAIASVVCALIMRTENGMVISNVKIKQIT